MSSCVVSSCFLTTLVVVFVLSGTTCEAANGVFVIDYSASGSWTSYLVNGTTSSLMCSGSHLGYQSGVENADLFPLMYEQGYYTFAVVLYNTSGSSPPNAPVSFYSMGVDDASSPPLCYNPVWICNPVGVASADSQIVGLALSAQNTTIVTYSADKQEVSFTIMIARETGGCYTEYLNSVQQVATSAPLVDFFVGQDGVSGIITVVDTNMLSLLAFDDAGVLFQVIDLVAQGYSKLYAAKFTSNSEPTLTVLGLTASGSPIIAEIPLSLTWGISTQVTIPFDIQENMYQAALYDDLGFLLAPTGSQTVYYVGFDQTQPFPVASSNYFLVSAQQQTSFGGSAKSLWQTNKKLH